MEIKEPAERYETSLWPSEFIHWERKSDTKHEYVNGTIVDMTGASVNHNKMLANIIGAINPFLKGKRCNVFPSDLRVYEKEKESYFYPDATIVCGELEFSDEEKDTVSNPTIIFEILSPSTQDYDIGTKLYQYMKILTLQQYIMIDSTSLLVRSGIRQVDGAWRFQELDKMEESIFLEAIQYPLPLKDVFEGINYPDPLTSLKRSSF